MHFKKQAQVRTLLFDKAFIKVLVKYSDYNNVFLAENAAKLPKNTGINKHTIRLEESKQPLFDLIYNLGPASRVRYLENLHQNQPGQWLDPAFQISC